MENDHGLGHSVVYQGMLNALMRDFERELFPICRNEGMGLASYGVLNHGPLQTEEGFKEKEKHNPGRKFVPLSDRDSTILEALEQSRTGIPLLHLALAYIMQKTPFAFADVSEIGEDENGTALYQIARSVRKPFWFGALCGRQQQV